MLILGEVHTGLLQHSTALTAPECEQVLGLVRGEVVRRFERPIAHVVSPDRLTGVDCRLASRCGARVRAIGTVAQRATITGGHIVQASATVEVTGGGSTNRLPWSHYLARPGVVETIGKPVWTDLADGFVSARPAGPTLDLDSISQRVMDLVQATRGLDRSPPLRATRTKLRWAMVTTGSADNPITFTIEDEQTRSVELTCTTEQKSTVAGFCEDLALHDWLLTTVLRMIGRSRIGSGPPAQAIHLLRPAIDHLLHLWMPAARVDQTFAELWQSLERRPGLSRQWQASVDRIRDQIAVNTITLLGAGAGGREQ